jgi:thioredoxin reductase (NADPH)
MGKSAEKRDEGAVRRPPSGGGEYDCAIVGGGPAGLSAALYLGRLRRSVVVIDDKEGRSTWQQINRNYLGFPDGIHATALRELGEEQARRYGAEFVDARATGVRVSGEGRDRRFTVSTTRGEQVARTLILATGVTDRFPKFDGSEECIGKSMFWCTICDGYESIGKRVVVLGNNDRAASLALELLDFTKTITLVSGDEPFDLEPRRRQALGEQGVPMYESACNIYRCTTEGELGSVELDDGTELDLDMLFVAQWIKPNTQLASQLNMHQDEHGYIRADAEQCTNVDGVFAAGDVTRLHNHQVTSAVHEGGMAAAAANYYLYEDWQKD